MQVRTSENPRQPSPPDHPALETWIAYHSGDVPEQEEQHLQNHLITCRSCLQLLLSLADFTSGEPPESVRGLEFAKEATWRLLKPKVQPRRHSHRHWIAAAAMLAVVLSFAGWNLVEQHGELQDFRNSAVSPVEPQANAAIFDLRPGGSLRSRQSQSQRLVISEESGFTLILNLLETTSTTVWNAHILDASRTSVAQVEGLQLDDLGTLTLFIPPGRLAEGTYTVELRRDGEPESTPPVESYAIEIAHPQ